jgi:hypothetical protein
VPLPAVAAALAEAQRKRDARFAELDAAIRAERKRGTPRIAPAPAPRVWPAAIRVPAPAPRKAATR